MLSAITLLVLLALLPAAGGEDLFVPALRAGRVPEAGLSALDDHLAFERALHEVLSTAGAEGDALSMELLTTSPLRVPRSFTDGRVPTGWDLVVERACAALNVRRPDLAEDLADVRRLLDPDVWRVADGLAALDRLVAAAGDDPAVSSLLFQLADRIAPFDRHRRTLVPIVARGVELAPYAHDRRMAALRLAHAQDGAGGPGARDLWEAAAVTAPTSLDAELLRLAAAMAAGRSEDPAQRDRARMELSELARDAEHGEVAERTLVCLATTAPSMSEALRHVDGLRDLGARPERVDGLLLVLARDRRMKQPPEAPTALLERLDAAADVAGDSPRAVCLRWAAADMLEERLGQRDGADPSAVDDVVERLQAAAAPALAGIEPEPVLAPISEWWLLIDEAPERALRPVQYARAACWQLADLSWRYGRWEDVLVYGRFPPPAEGCGNVRAASERVSAEHRADALEGLGRRDDALELRVGLLLGAAMTSDVQLAAVGLAEFVVRADLDEPALALLSGQPPTLAERAGLGVDLIGLRRALVDGAPDAEERLEAFLATSGPVPELSSRLRRWERGGR